MTAPNSFELMFIDEGLEDVDKCLRNYRDGSVVGFDELRKAMMDSLDRIDKFCEKNDHGIRNSTITTYSTFGADRRSGYSHDKNSRLSVQFEMPPESEEKMDTMLNSGIQLYIDEEAEESTSMEERMSRAETVLSKRIHGKSFSKEPVSENRNSYRSSRYSKTLRSSGKTTTTEMAEIPQATRLFLHQILAKLNILENYLDKLHLFVGQMEMMEVSEGFSIVTQGDDGDYFYCIEDGDVVFVENDIDVRCGTRGTSFGELSLLFNMKRSCSCIAKSQVKLWRIKKDAFKAIVQESNHDTQQLFVYFQTNTMFAALTPGQKINMIHHAPRISFVDKASIYNEDEVDGNMYFIVSGQVKLSTYSNTIGHRRRGLVNRNTVLGPGQAFGERAMFDTVHVRDHSAVAVGKEVELLCIDRVTAIQSFGDEKLLCDSIRKTHGVMEGLPYKILDLTVEEISAIMQLVDLKVRHNTDDPINLDDSGWLVTFLSECSCSIKTNSGTEILHFRSGQCRYFSNPTSLSFIGQVLLLNSVNANRAIKNGMAAILSVVEVDGYNMVCELEAPKKTLADLKFQRKLGEGTYGKVYLVTDRIDDLYALKKLDKRTIVADDMVEETFTEKDIMNRIHHPLIIDLIATFQDHASLYMLSSFYSGGELSDRIPKTGTMPLNDAKFYAACILEGIAHLHQYNIGHRDLKPANVMVDGDGYCVIIDVGCAKVFDDGFASTQIGTPFYMAPEIFKLKHDFTVDLWALGVILYEFLVGRRPFVGLDETSLFRKILKFSYTIPEFVNEDASSLISSILVKRRKRITMSDIRKHDYFKDIHWDDLYNKKILAPWKPEVFHVDKENSKEISCIFDNKDKFCDPSIDELFASFAN
mmetsp:Transcript_6323/g.8331  ORF Transcript_6323/g.8331 Transcript_6323/m.8331 type:complete len:870 (-) Transcript_6323:201-2810(-)|eukprot:CAMPEP_0116054912 /NCGR_PEP_ID=MMETSP0322-20121206/3093_1 /TAXON_ID=163516 /ORGANISM="Leptocylindrus danicus var. apora, Strain B651" /LENGTH=869 /DNA_ID=CAMNT_0003538413 /DNA_START=520 /DNA_END=3129 /DNA_ORIENTATION=-